MARPWRIRHKLMLGMATVVVVLVMVLAGPAYGVWSYYVTMSSLGDKLNELDKAEDFKRRVNDLNLPETVDNPQEEARRLHKNIAGARAALDQCDLAFQTSLDRNWPEDEGQHIRGLLNDLRDQLTQLERDNVPPKVEGGVGMVASSGVTTAPRQEYRNRVQRDVGELERTSSDLREAIRAGLTHRIGGESRRHYQRSILVLSISGAISLILMASLLRYFYGWVFYPIRDLQQGVKRLAQGEFEYRIQLDSGDEMAELAVTFNDMTSRLHALYQDLERQVNERSRQLVRSERLASVGFLAAGVAHEINNPLASIAFCSEALEARLNEMLERLRQKGLPLQDLEIFAKYLKMIQEEAFRCKNITERLLESSRGGEGQRERTDLVHLVQAVLDVTQHLQNSRGKEIAFQHDPAVSAWVNAEEIKSVVLNLVVNGLDSMDEGGKLTIDLRQRDGMAELSLTDTGCGMNEEVLENIFEPFFTRNRSGKGTGLGLTITHRIVSQHGGEIEASSDGDNKGSTFQVRLPLQAQQQAA